MVAQSDWDPMITATRALAVASPDFATLLPFLLGF
jgi:hypothetical protein